MSEFNPGNMAEEDFGKLYTDVIEFNLASIKALLNYKYKEEFGVHSILLNPGEQSADFSAFPVGNESFLFSGRLLGDGKISDDYIARTVMLSLEKEVAACFAENGLQAVVRVETKPAEDIPVEEKGARWLDFFQDHACRYVSLRIILLNGTVPQEQLEAKMRETVWRLAINVDVSLYIYSFASADAFAKCREEVFAKPRVTNCDIEYYVPDLKIPMWINRQS